MGERRGEERRGEKRRSEKVGREEEDVGELLQRQVEGKAVCTGDNNQLQFESERQSGGKRTQRGNRGGESGKEAEERRGKSRTKASTLQDITSTRVERVKRKTRRGKGHIRRKIGRDTNLPLKIPAGAPLKRKRVQIHPGHQWLAQVNRL